MLVLAKEAHAETAFHMRGEGVGVVVVFGEVIALPRVYALAPQRNAAHAFAMLVIHVLPQVYAESRKSDNEEISERYAALPPEGRRVLVRVIERPALNRLCEGDGGERRQEAHRRENSCYA